MVTIHELLAQWIIKYMNLEKSKGNEGKESVKELLKE